MPSQTGSRRFYLGIHALGESVGLRLARRVHWSLVRSHLGDLADDAHVPDRHAVVGGPRDPHRESCLDTDFDQFPLEQLEQQGHTVEYGPVFRKLTQIVANFP